MQRKNFKLGKKAAKGFTIVELVIVIGILGTLMALFSEQLNKGNLTEQVIMQKDLDNIATAAVKYASGRQFTGVTVATLCSDGYINGSPCGASNNGTGANPWGGDYKVVVNATNPNRFDLSATKVPKNVGTEMARNYSGTARSSVFTAATGTLLLVFGTI